jgi:uncharacterized membrane protein SirB2
MEIAHIKSVHVACALISISLFVVRGVWMMIDSRWLRRTWVRILPHVVDTLLLVSALVLVFQAKLYPGAQQPWLVAKIVALVVYIGLGLIALRPGRPKPVRIAAWLAAVAVFAYIYLVAITHNPMPLPL